ncbi:MAG: hypothetical protein ACK5RL_16140 [Acidimicrobiales bacterium]
MITVVPDRFTQVFFDADRIASLTTAALARVPELDLASAVEVRVDQNAATSQATVTSVDPIVFAVDSGALEDYRDPRYLGDEAAAVTLTRLFLEVADRRRDDFGGPDLDAEVSLAHAQAWDVVLHGRTEALGLELYRPRYRYNFRNRHGFTDAADAVFDRLWTAGPVPWDQIVAWSDEATAVAPSGL